MIRFAILVVVVAVCLWAPWMDRQSAEHYAEYILAAYGPMPATCYDVDNNVVQEGVEVRWYPLGRLVHTCSGDFMVWSWGDVKEMGGIAKKAEDIQPVRSKALTCEEVLERKEARRASSTDSQLDLYTGPIASTPDFSMFPEAQQHRSVITVALKGGVDFAGQFAIATWACGSNCEGHAVIDVTNGQVVAYGLETEYGISYSPESTVLVTNPTVLMQELPDNSYDVETLALSLARLPREYYRLTHDRLSDTRYLVRECMESSTAGYIEVEDDRIDIVTDALSM